MSTYPAKKTSALIRKVHREISDAVEKRIREFDAVWKRADDTRLFVEMVFCLLTPQSGARRCWGAVENLLRGDILFTGGFDEICRELNIVRFKNRKTSYILEAREAFYGPGKSLRRVLRSCGDVSAMRDWIFRNVKGLGYKEASHYLRNIGLGEGRRVLCVPAGSRTGLFMRKKVTGEGLAILDRHILRSMHAMGLIDQIPSSISRTQYLEMENILDGYARSIGVPLAHLDFVLWYQATGDIFK